VKRGTVLERVLAIAGTGVWVAFVVLDLRRPANYIGSALGSAAAIWSVVEILRWQAGKESHWFSGRPGRMAYPSLAWFALGLIPASALAASTSGGWIYQPVAWLALGGLTTWLLTRNAERRDRRATATIAPPTQALEMPLERVPSSDKPRYEELLKKRREAGLSDAEAAELGRMMMGNAESGSRESD
jgi:hypothetical protein